MLTAEIQPASPEVPETNLRKRLKTYALIAWLPITLTVLLAIETTLFNRWLDIIPQLYLLRRTAASLALGALLFGPAIFFSRRARYIYLSIFSVLIAALFIAQFIYYRYSGGFLEFSALFYAGQATDLDGTISQLISAELLLFILPLLIILGSVLFDLWQKHRAKQFTAATSPAPIKATSNKAGANKAAPNLERKLSVREKLVGALCIIVVFLGGYGALIQLEIHDWGDATRLYDKIYDLGTLVGKAGVINFYIEDAIKFAFEPHDATQAQKNLVTSWVAAKPAPPANPKDFGIAKGRNLIMIQVESLENWPINATIDSQEITPNLNKLAQQGLYFTNYYSQIGQGNTADAEFSSQDSLYPLPDSVVFITHADNKLNALPDLLKDNGYSTAVMHGDIATFWNRSNIYPQIGYEHQFSSADYQESRPIGFDGLGDGDFFQQSLPKLQSLPQPFMDTAITLSSHTPFYIPEDLQTLKINNNDTAITDPATSSDGNLDLFDTREQYAQSVRYADDSLGKFIDGLKADNLYNNSLIVIYGDHNAFLGTADSANNQVPLIILAPGLNLPHGTTTEPGSHLDLYPTIANLLGVQAPKSIIGQDLFNSTAPVVTQRNIITGTIKFIISGDKKYTASSDSEFGNGTCAVAKNGVVAANPQILPVTDCQDLYNQEQQKIDVSDTVVRYNLLPLMQGQ